MAADVVVPEVGETGMDVTFVRWCKAAGDVVAAGDILFELDTEKTVVEVEAWTDGVLADLLAAAGDVVAPRQVIARILAPGEATATAPTTAIDDPTSIREPEGSPASSGAPPARATLPGAASPSSGSSSPSASPRARRLAREQGIDLAELSGSGPDGLITERDVLAASGDGDGEGRA